jgi:hypothetical protein
MLMRILGRRPMRKWLRRASAGDGNKNDLDVATGAMMSPIHGRALRPVEPVERRAIFAALHRDRVASR